MSTPCFAPFLLAFVILDWTYSFPKPSNFQHSQAGPCLCCFWLELLCKCFLCMPLAKKQKPWFFQRCAHKSEFPNRFYFALGCLLLSAGSGLPCQIFALKGSVNLLMHSLSQTPLAEAGRIKPTWDSLGGNHTPAEGDNPANTTKTRSAVWWP